METRTYGIIFRNQDNEELAISENRDLDDPAGAWILDINGEEWWCTSDELQDFAAEILLMLAGGKSTTSEKKS